MEGDRCTDIESLCEIFPGEPLDRIVKWRSAVILLALERIIPVKTGRAGVRLSELSSGQKSRTDAFLFCFLKCEGALVAAD